MSGGHLSIIFAERQDRRSIRCRKKEESKTDRFLMSRSNTRFGCDRIKLLGGGYEEILAILMREGERG